MAVINTGRSRNWKKRALWARLLSKDIPGSTFAQSLKYTYWLKQEIPVALCPIFHSNP